MRARELSEQRPDDAAWVPGGQAVQVAGAAIAGGNFYLGQSLRSMRPYGGGEPALVNPALPVDFTKPDWSGECLGYWPQYSDLTPAGRAAYLSWLSGPRESTQVAIGYVFLYFYGLERRALVDAIASPTGFSELPWIVAEVERLLGIYGTNNSFQRYASNFLGVLRGLLERPGVPQGPPPPFERDPSHLLSFFPLDLRLGLGRFVMARHPIPGLWALAWLQASPEVYLRTPAFRCPDEFAHLFSIRYDKRFGEGMIIKPNKTRIRASYRAASSSFGPEFHIPVEDLPDVTALTAPVKVLKGIADECTDALDSYSRWLGRNSTRKGSLAGAALLPPELAHGASSGALDELTQWLESQLADQAEAVVDAAELVRRWPAQTPGKLTKSEASALAQLLNARGYGVEPDVRFAGPVLGAGRAVVFRVDGLGAGAGPAWASAAAVFQLAAAVAAPGARSDAVLDAVADQIQAALHLPPSEHNRIHAHLRWAAISTPSLNAAKRALGGTDSAAREAIGTFLVDVATANSDVGPEQVSALTKAYKALDLEPASMYALIHERTSRPPALEPIVIRRARPGVPGEVIPPASPAAAPNTVVLDQDAIRAKLAESAKAAALLGEIFADEEDGSSPPAPPESIAPPGLRGAYASLLRELSARPVWSHDDFVDLTSQLGLLPAAAIEALNEAALEKCGEPVLDGDDVLAINPAALKELLP